MAIVTWMQLIKKINLLLATCVLLTATKMSALHVAKELRLTPAQRKGMQISAQKKTAPKINWSDPAARIAMLESREKIIEELQPDEWRVCENDTTNCIKVKKKVLNVSNALKGMLEDIGDAKADLPIDLPITMIKKSFDLLSKSLESNGLESIKTEIQTYPFDLLVTTFNCIHYLDCPNIENVFLTLFKKKITENNGQITVTPTFQQLDPNAQKSLMIKPIINFLDPKSLKRNIKILPQRGFDNSLFSPDCSKLAGITDNNSIIIYDAGRELYDIFSSNKYFINNYSGNLAFSPDSKEIAFYDENNLFIVNVETKEVVRLNGVKNISTAAFSHDSKTIALSMDSSIAIYSSLTGNKIKEFVTQPNIKQLAFSPDGKMLASGSSDNDHNLKLWEVTTGAEFHDLPGHSGHITSLAFSPDGSKLLSASFTDQNNLKLWDVATGREIHNFKGHTTPVGYATFSHNGKSIASGGRENEHWNITQQSKIFIWNVENAEQLHNLSSDMYNNNNIGNIVAFSPDDSKLISRATNVRITGTGNNIGGSLHYFHSLSVYNVETGKRIYSTEQATWIWTASFSPDGHKIFAYMSDTSSYLRPHELAILSFLSPQELGALNKCSAEQTALLYRLSLTQQDVALKLNPTDQALFNSLSPEVQSLLTNLGVVEMGWKKWLLSRPWKKIVGGTAAAGAASYGLYKYLQQEK